jgi:L-asparaginase II
LRAFVAAGKVTVLPEAFPFMHDHPAEATADPVLVEATRGDMIESRHRGAVAVVDAAGRLVLALGDVERPVFARSAIKPLQALPLVESGAADRFGLGEQELALACASHHGESVHVAAVAHWLERLGLGPDDLECGAHLPNDTAAAHALIRAGAAPSPLHNNCSGKHAGFLTTARHLGEPTRGYIQPDHPVQRRVLAVLEAMTGRDLSRAPRGTDGCGIPVIGIPLSAMAQAMARLADPREVPGPRAAAGRRLLDAMAAKPLMVDGTGGFPTLVMEAAGQRVRLKPGAEGVFCAALPTLRLGVALKIESGNGRAAEVAMGAVLQRLGAFTAVDASTLAPLLRPIINNVAGRRVGEMRAATALAT